MSDFDGNLLFSTNFSNCSLCLPISPQKEELLDINLLSYQTKSLPENFPEMIDNEIELNK